MHTIRIKHRNGAILFEHTALLNSIEETLREAAIRKISLAGADLRGLVISTASIHDIDLSGADLRNSTIIASTFVRVNLLDITVSNRKGPFYQCYFMDSYLTMYDENGLCPFKAMPKD